MNALLLQITTAAVDSTAAIPELTSSNLFTMVSQIGYFGLFVMGLIFVLSVITVYITIERYTAIKKASTIDENFMNRIKDFVASGNIAGAKDWCDKEDSPIAHMIGKGVVRIGKSLKDIQTSIENQGNLEVGRLEKGMNVLATISGAAPMLGFLGTVTGMITTFKDLAEGNTGAGDLAGGLYEAMFTTAFGLAAGIISFVAYNMLTSMLDKIILKMEAASIDFVDMLQEPSK
ncbi:MAG: biopolymer transport protein ExbB [Chitinophagales bacterium]|jgi:biopolymer transport protein ExbB